MSPLAMQTRSPPMDHLNLSSLHDQQNLSFICQYLEETPSLETKRSAKVEPIQSSRIEIDSLLVLHLLNLCFNGVYASYIKSKAKCSNQIKSNGPLSGFLKLH